MSTRTRKDGRSVFHSRASSRRRRMAIVSRVSSLAGVVAAVMLGGGCGSAPSNPSGTLEATEIDVAPAIGGRVLEVRPELGDIVAAGDTMVVLDTELIALQREETATNRKSIAAQRLVAEDALAQAQRNLELTETTLRRAKSLLAQGSATQQQIDDLEAKRDVIASQVSAARHQLESVAAEDGKLQAALAVLDRRLQDGVLVSPTNGTVLVRALEPGEMAVPGGPGIRMADLSRLELRVFLEEGDLDRVKIGQTFPVLVDALAGEEIVGTVEWVSDEAEFTPKNAQTRNARAQLVYAVKLRVDNSDGRLHIGMPAEVRM
jgi:HlyD family secretion protein